MQIADRAAARSAWSQVECIRYLFTVSAVMQLGVPLIIIVIFLVIWIVSNVIRAQQDAAQAAARKSSTNRTTTTASGGGKPTSDIDRFLQEIDRLRKKGQQDKTPETAAPPPPEPPASKPKPRPQPARTEPARQPRVQRPRTEPRPVPPPPPAPPPHVQSTAPVELIPIVEQVEPSPGSLAAELDATRPATTSKSAPPPPPPRTRRESGQAGSPTIRLLQKLFESREGAAAAILLHEILGPPRCRRS